MTQPISGGVGVADRQYAPVQIPRADAPAATHAPDSPASAVRSGPVAAPTTHDVQAVAEDADAPARVEFLGQHFALAEGVAIMPLMKLALSAQGGVDSNDMKALAAMAEVIRNCLHRPALIDPDTGAELLDPETGRVARDEREWQRFEEHATDRLADDEDMSDFMQKAIEAISARPRKRRGNSSATSPVTSEKSRGASSSPAMLPGGRVPVGADELTVIADVAR